MKSDDARMLAELGAWAAGNEEEAESLNWPVVFAKWLEQEKSISDKQRAWLRGVYDQIIGEPQYENAWSEGNVPRGEALATPVPEVLKKPLPLRPPGRRA